MSELPKATLGRIGLAVARLGYGAMELRGGRRRVSTPESIGRLLHAVLDAGIDFIDTSPDYGGSEEAIGEHLAARRQTFFLASKCGCPIDLPAPAPGQRPPHVFTRANLRAGVERSLRRMKTDYLDLVQFHISPSRAVLLENDSLVELSALKQEGKVRFIGMSGTLPHLEDHIAMGVFDAFQIPYSALERQHEAVITRAAAAGAGIVIRGGVARGLPVAPPAALSRLPGPFRSMVEARRGLWDKAGLAELCGEMTEMELMLRFTLSHPAMTTTIVGTANLDHLAENVAAARKGPLPAALYAQIKQHLDEAAAAGAAH